MRKSQTLRNQHLRNTSASGSNADDLGIIKDRTREESPEGALARQFVDAERENDKVGVIELRL
jgi:hypothetical protein